MSRRWQNPRTPLWLASFLAAFIATHLPPSKMPSHMPLSNAVLHFLGYGALGIMTVWRLGAEPTPLGLKRWFAWLAFLMGFAILDEVSQPLVGRSCELGDWTMDVCGIIVGMTIAAVFAHRRATRP